MSVPQVLATLWKIPTFRHLLLGFSVTYFFGYGLSQWQPTFFVRSFGLGTGELGMWFTVISGVIGTIGTCAGGEWASRRASGNEALQLGAVAVAYALIAVLSVLIYIVPNHYAAFCADGRYGARCFRRQPAIVRHPQTLVPPHMRAMSIATIYLVANLIGMGLGPLTVESQAMSCGQSSVRNPCATRSSRSHRATSGAHGISGKRVPPWRAICAHYIPEENLNGEICASTICIVKLKRCLRI